MTKSSLLNLTRWQRLRNLIGRAILKLAALVITHPKVFKEAAAVIVKAAQES